MQKLRQRLDKLPKTKLLKSWWLWLEPRRLAPEPGPSREAPEALWVQPACGGPLAMVQLQRSHFPANS